MRYESARDAKSSRNSVIPFSMTERGEKLVEPTRAVPLQYNILTRQVTWNNPKFHENAVHFLVTWNIILSALLLIKCTSGKVTLDLKIFSFDRSLNKRFEKVPRFHNLFFLIPIANNLKFYNNKYSSIKILTNFLN